MVAGDWPQGSVVCKVSSPFGSEILPVSFMLEGKSHVDLGLIKGDRCSILCNYEN